ncbi:MAG TPA: hypothetical protein VF715_12445 [Thermoleophilaceae bacterium]|jgi:hypothetical protein
MDIDRIQSARRDFMRIAEQAGLPEPDEVHYFEAEEELEFVWHEQKLAVVVELDEFSAAAVADDVPF